MKKKGLMIFATFLAAATLAGCQNKPTKKAVQKQEGVGTVKVNHSNNSAQDDNENTASSTKSDTIWDSAKQAKLDTFMNEWGPTMKQHYVKYSGSGQIKTNAGEKFPKDFDNVQVNGEDATLEYHPNGEGDADYNVVAIYNYDEGAAEFHITYFFAFHDGKPIVLVDQTTNGDKIQAEETQNKDLINGFNSIAGGDSASVNSSSSDSDSEETEDPKRLGVFVSLLKKPEWFKYNVKNGHMYYSDEDTGYHCLSSHGDATSMILYKQSGSMVTVKYVDATNSDNIADAPMVTKKYTIQRLRDDYYVNSGQKAEVNGYVDKLKDDNGDD